MYVYKSLYLSETENLKEITEKTELALDELEEIVGRFRNHSIRKGRLRGEFIELYDGRIFIRHHFTKKKLWEKLCEIPTKTEMLDYLR